MAKKHIAVLFGGASSEHEVSRVSASYVIDHIPSDKYEVIRIGITKQGRWYLYNGSLDDIRSGAWENNPENRVAFISPDTSVKGIVVLEGEKAEIIPIDVAFPVLHGKYGEDGTVQGLFRLAGIPFVGCDVLASADCMDKIVSNIIFEHEKIEQAAFTWLYAYEYRQNQQNCLDKVEKALPAYPIFVKPSNAGSSVGVTKANSREELKKAIEIAMREDDRILFEETIVGKEVECAVMGNDHPIAAVPGEIAPANEFYDYEAKYQNDASLLFIPARISEELAEKVRTTAIRAYKAIGCTGLSRVDFFVTDDGRVLLNEINTLPGFTSISMYPKLMAAYGLKGSDLIEKLIDYAFERFENHV